jgi:Hemerythrin HHE cation binding domain
MDITQLILDDHHEQRRLFAIIEQLGQSQSANAAAVWKRLAAFLEVHALAEERHFYPELMAVGHGVGDDDGPAPETKDAIKDHNEIRDAVAAVERHAAGSPDWWAAVAKANKANGDHMAEEEREGLTDFRMHASLEMRHDLGVQFTVFEAHHVTGVTPKNVDPETYVRAHDV